VPAPSVVVHHTGAVAMVNGAARRPDLSGTGEPLVADRHVVRPGKADQPAIDEQPVTNRGS
jgi:hypothetical protein